MLSNVWVSYKHNNNNPEFFPILFTLEVIYCCSRTGICVTAFLSKEGEYLHQLATLVEMRICQRSLNFVGD